MNRSEQIYSAHGSFAHVYILFRTFHLGGKCRLYRVPTMSFGTTVNFCSYFVQYLRSYKAKTELIFKWCNWLLVHRVESIVLRWQVGFNAGFLFSGSATHPLGICT